MSGGKDNSSHRKKHYMPLSLQPMNNGKSEEHQTPGGSSEKIRIGAVSYLNTKPLIYGFDHGMMKDEVELIIDHPANIASALLSGAIDAGLVPVAIIPFLKSHHIISDYCIAADDDVASVCLFSEVPLQQVERVLLDYQSRTSVMLARYLFKHHWKMNPEFVDAGENFIEGIGDTTAAVVIGDRAFQQRKISAYSYDLAHAWNQHTGLPFVFAAWVSNKPLPPAFTANFNAACHYGLTHLDQVIKENPYPLYDLREYYTKNIKFQLDEEKLKGLQLFLDWCSSQYGVLQKNSL